MGEFELIERVFRRPQDAERGAERGVALGIGDDCALLRPSPGMALAVSTDLLIEGRHFLSTVAPERLGHKALAVNLSDLAACGARPLAFTLGLVLPRVEPAFVQRFADGLFALADTHGLVLAGGDTTAGPLAIAITVFGEVPERAALLRSGARPGDDLWVSGTLGDARLALEAFRGHVSLPGAAFDRVRVAMECPSPRVALGLALRGVASAAIDVSDGFAGDLGHVLTRSGVGATVEIDALPRSDDLATLADESLRRTCLLHGGDDYELVFTAPPAARDRVLAAGAGAGVAVTRCGRLEAEPGLRLIDRGGRVETIPARGFDHFAPG
jgi:thiamine-monophosphate kinase